MTTRILLADDQALLRSTFRILIESEPDMTVVAEAADVREAVDLGLRYRPDVVLMDIRMPGVEVWRPRPRSAVYRMRTPRVYWS